MVLLLSVWWGDWGLTLVISSSFRSMQAKG